jgi:hypothetical protein
VRQDLLDRDQLFESEVADQLRLEQLGHSSHRHAIEDLILPDLLGRGRSHEGTSYRESSCQFGSKPTRWLAHVTCNLDRASAIRLVIAWHAHWNGVPTSSTMLVYARARFTDLVCSGWFVAAMTVAACSLFAAHGVAALVEASYLTTWPTSAPPPSKHADIPPPRPHRDGASLVERNMFCSTCSAALGSGPSDPFVPGAFLIAISQGAEPRATVRVPGSEVQGSFGIGDVLPGVGKIVDIGWVEIEIVDAAGRHGRLSLLAPGAATPGSEPAAPARSASPWEGRIRRIDDRTYEVERSLVRELVTGAVRPGGTRILPVADDAGRLAGLRIAGAGLGSMAAAIGLRNGDMLSEINGKHIESANTLIDLYGRLDDLHTVELDGTRGKQPLALTVQLR